MSSKVTDYIQSVFGNKSCDNDIIELLYYLLMTTGNSGKFNGQYNMLEERFAVLWIMQLGETIIICNTSTFFDLNKAINALLLVGLFSLNV